VTSLTLSSDRRIAPARRPSPCWEPWARAGRGALAKQLFPAIGAAGTVTLRLVTAAALLLAFTRPRLRLLSGTQLRLLAGFGGVLALMNLSFYAHSTGSRSG